MDKLRLSREGAVRTVTLARPEARNALDAQMLEALVTAFSGEPAPEERVAVIRADGPVFCAGLDLKARLQSDPASWAGESPVEEALHAVEQWPLPVVAVVQGDAIAGGNELALHCDLVVASSEARFGMSLAQVGLAPSWFLTKKLLEVAGPVVTREILLLGDPLPAQRMADLGVIARCVAPEELQATASAIIERLVANAPLSLRAMKATINREMAFRDGIEHGDTDQLVRAALKSNDAKEGVRARMERRSANFTGT